jgi:hypothetical protein
MADYPTREFGKRRREPPTPSVPPTPLDPAPKRSSHVALLLMGAFAVGGAAYALMPRETCTPPSPGMAQPGVPQANTTNCASRGWMSGSGGHSSSSRYGFFGDDSSSRSSSSASSSEASSSSVSRGGFGGFAHAFGFSGSG